MTFLARAFGLRPKLTSLLALGSAVCGVSAIIATKGAIEADDEDSSFAIALGALYSDAAGKLAVLAKTTRNAVIGFVVLAYAIYWAGQAKGGGNKAAFLWRKSPKFVLGSLLISVLATDAFFHQRPGRA